MKKPVGTLDAVPSKRLFLSIIADYDLRRSICELVDNGLDEWVRRGRPSGICINIILDRLQQTISVIDNAGGLPREELLNVVGPGHTGSKQSDETIGIFGVGTKRAVVALGQDIKITTRHSKGGTFRIEFDDDWLKEDDNWILQVYQVDEIAAGTTRVEISRLRLHLTEEEEENLRDHLEATYARFLTDVRIELNGEPLVLSLEK
jgi:DNA topoisomerase VI subunit B